VAIASGSGGLAVQLMTRSPVALTQSLCVCELCNLGIANAIPLR
jgi:hypothetical protein